MGCVLSPDRAKMYVDSIIEAIEQTCRGVRWWGDERWGGPGSGFADDYAGAFESEMEMGHAWALFRCWEKAFGQAMGHKDMKEGKQVALKTAVSGVVYEDGKPTTPKDPKLRYENGTAVPFLSPDKWYKHLGFKRCANGDGRENLRLVVSKAIQSLKGLRKLRGVGVGGFCAVANVVIGGLVGYYCSTEYLDWKAAEKIEGCFRKEFNRRFHRAHSTARLPLYVSFQGRKPLRVHAYTTAAASLHDAVNAAVSDSEDTMVRRAARSAVARAMCKWGCRGEPMDFRWGSKRAELQQALEGSRVRQLGEAWMLAAAIMDGHLADCAYKDGKAGQTWEGGTSRWRLVGGEGDGEALMRGRGWWRGLSSLQDGWDIRPTRERARGAVLRRSTVRLHELARDLSRPEPLSPAQWHKRLAQAVGASKWQAGTRADWSPGAVDREQLALGPRIWFVRGRRVQAVGGEGKWLCGQHEELDELGFVRGWERRAQDVMCRLRWRNDGALLIDGALGTEGAASELGPAAQLVFTANQRTRGIAVEDGPVMKKQRVATQFVNLHASALEAEELVNWAERIDAEAVFTLDGTLQAVQRGEGEVMVAAWAAAMQDGTVDSGALPESSRDNYMGEFAAQLCAAGDRGVRRMVVEFDAMGPVQVLLRWLRTCRRRRMRIYRRHWVDEWWRRLVVFEAVVFVHRSSHTGAVVNELADLHADAAAKEAAEEEEPTLGEASFTSLEVMAATNYPIARGLRETSLRAHAAHVQQRLASGDVHAQVWCETDLSIKPFAGELGDVAAAVLAGRCQAADDRRYCSGLAMRLVAEAGCPFGCGCHFRWHEVAFTCRGAEIVQSRGMWQAALVETFDYLADKDYGKAAGLLAPHTGMLELRRLLDKGVGMRAWATRSYDEVRARRHVGGLWGSFGPKVVDGDSELMRRIRCTVRAGLELQQLGRKATSQLEERIREEVAQARRARPWVARWKRAVVRGGPRRASALRDVAVARLSAAVHITRGGGPVDAAAGMHAFIDAANRTDRWRMAAASEAVRDAAKSARAESLRPASIRRARWEWRLVGVLRLWRVRVRDACGSGPAAPPSVLRVAAMTAAGALGDSIPWRREGSGNSARGRSITARWRAARAWGRAPSKAAMRREWAADVEAGLETSSRGWHVVARLVDVRRSVPRRGLQLDVLVEWEGVEYFTQRPYPPAWLPVTSLRPELAAEARVMEAARWPPERIEIPEGTRKQPRRTGDGRDRRG